MKRTIEERSDFNGNNMRNTHRKIQTSSTLNGTVMDITAEPENGTTSATSPQLQCEVITPSPSTRCKLEWFQGPEKDLECFHRNISLPYTPAPLDVDLLNMFEDNLKQINLDLFRLLSIDISHVMISCIVYDPFSTNENERQVHLVDKKLIPAVLSSDLLNNTQVYILSIKTLLDKSADAQIAIIDKIINAVFESCSQQERQQKQDGCDKTNPVVLFIPRLERFYEHLSSSVIQVLSESLLEAGEKPILILATTAWTSETLPSGMAKLFKGRLGSIEHEITPPSVDGRFNLFSKIFSNHYIFKLSRVANAQCQKEKQLLRELKNFPLKHLRTESMRVTFNKPASVVMTLYQNLDVTCKLFGNEWNDKPSLASGAYSLLLALQDLIKALDDNPLIKANETTGDGFTL